MIDSNVLSVVERRVAQDMKDRRDVFSREVAQIWESVVAKGTLHSSTTALLIMDAIGNELKVRASLIWQAFAQALSTKGILINEAISSEIKQYVSQMLNNHSSDLPEHYGRLKGLVRDFVPLKSLFELTTSASDRINTNKKLGSGLFY